MSFRTQAPARVQNREKNVNLGGRRKSQKLTKLDRSLFYFFKYQQIFYLLKATTSVKFYAI